MSYASSSHAENPQNVVQSLVAIRMKLKRSIVLRANIIYEASLTDKKYILFPTEKQKSQQFSLRGRWPAERYQKILEIQLLVSTPRRRRFFTLIIFLQRNCVPSFASDVGGAEPRTSLDESIPTSNPIFGPRLSRGRAFRHK